MKAVFVLALALLAASSHFAHAQNDVCMDNNGNINQSVTEGWQRFQANANPQTMQMLVGTWYSERPNPATGQVEYRNTILEPNGLFTVQSKVCSGNNSYCSDFPGHGFWAAQPQNGGVVIFSIYSDTAHTNYCNFTQFQMPDQSTLQDNTGFSLRRVQ